MRGTTSGWDCKDIKIFVGQASFEGVDPAMRAKLNKVPTRLRLKTDEVDLVIEAGRLATRSTPEFNGFLGSLAGNSVESRIEKGIAAGGRRLAPVSN